MRTDRYKEEAVRKDKKKKKKGSRILKVLLLLILLLLIAIPLTLQYTYKDAKDSLALTFKSNDLKVEVGSNLRTADFIGEYEGDLSLSADYLDSETIGDKEIVCTVSKSLYGGLAVVSEDFILKYSVCDTTPPIMLWSGDGALVQRGTEFDIKSVVGYGDNADPNPSIKYDGDIDMSTEGTYPLRVTVSDASGNSIHWDTNITVADSLPSYISTFDPYPFKSFKKAHAGDGRHFGIDVSSWQGDIDFEKVKAAGCEFVIIRAGYSIDGKVEIDNTFKQNYKRAKEAGIPIGLYLYSYDNTEEKARSSARWIIEQLGGDKIDYPIAFDWEDFGQFQSYEMSFIGLNKMYDAFADELASAGYDCMLYGSLNYLEKIWTDTDTRPVWLAHYTDQTDYKGPYRIWQASSSGSIDGIGGAVDMNIMYDQP